MRSKAYEVILERLLLNALRDVLKGHYHSRHRAIEQHRCRRDFDGHVPAIFAAEEHLPTEHLRVPQDREHGAGVRRNDGSFVSLNMKDVVRYAACEVLVGGP